MLILGFFFVCFFPPLSGVMQLACDAWLACLLSYELTYLMILYDHFLLL
jgi:hypothetical protein